MKEGADKGGKGGRERMIEGKEDGGEDGRRKEEGKEGRKKKETSTDLLFREKKPKTLSDDPMSHNLYSLAENR